MRCVSPGRNAGACPLVNAHEAAGADCLSCHSTCQAQAEVAISPANVNLAPGATQSFQATTTGGDNPPVYTWDLSASGGTADTTTGDTITYIAGPNPGNYTIKVTDTANGNIEATATVLIGELCNIGVVDESVRKSHWVALPALIRIQTAGVDVSQTTEVTFSSDAVGALKSVIPLVKLVNPTTRIIYQLAIIPPAIATGNFDAESETITVAVEGCDKTDTFDLDFLSLGPIPLSKFDVTDAGDFYVPAVHQLMKQMQDIIPCGRVRYGRLAGKHDQVHVQAEQLGMKFAVQLFIGPHPEPPLEPEADLLRHCLDLLVGQML